MRGAASAETVSRGRNVGGVAVEVRCTSGHACCCRGLLTTDGDRDASRDGDDVDGRIDTDNSTGMSDRVG